MYPWKHEAVPAFSEDNRVLDVSAIKRHSLEHILFKNLWRQASRILKELSSFCMLCWSHRDTEKTESSLKLSTRENLQNISYDLVLERQLRRGVGPGRPEENGVPLRLNKSFASILYFKVLNRTLPNDFLKNNKFRGQLAQLQCLKESLLQASSCIPPLTFLQSYSTVTYS